MYPWQQEVKLVAELWTEAKPEKIWRREDVRLFLTKIVAGVRNLPVYSVQALERGLCCLTGQRSQLDTDEMILFLIDIWQND